ncbi:hypothetical protein [Streptomyces malaysiensis]
MADFDRYLARDDADPAREGVVYRQGAVWLTDDEFAELVEEIEAAIARRNRTAPSDDRTRHIISFVVVPDNASGPDAGTDPS